MNTFFLFKKIVSTISLTRTVLHMTGYFLFISNICHCISSDFSDLPDMTDDYINPSVVYSISTFLHRAHCLYTRQIDSLRSTTHQLMNRLYRYMHIAANTSTLDTVGWIENNDAGTRYFCCYHVCRTDSESFLVQNGGR